MQLVHGPRVQGTEGSSSTTSTVKINIEGMRCESCVKNIEGTIGSRAGVVNIKVILEEKAGYVDFKVNQITGKELLEALEDMGFAASLCHDGQTSYNEGKPKKNILEGTASTCSIHVDGMTCTSCVKSITGENAIR